MLSTPLPVLVGFDLGGPNVIAKQVAPRELYSDLAIAQIKFIEVAGFLKAYKSSSLSAIVFGD